MSTPMWSTVKLYLIAGTVAACLAGLGLVYAKGRLDASHAADRKRLEDYITTLLTERAAEDAARRLDASQAKEDAEREDELEARITELEAYAATLTGSCLDGADIDILWDSLEGRNPASPPTPTGRPGTVPAQGQRSAAPRPAPRP